MTERERIQGLNQAHIRFVVHWVNCPLKRRMHDCADCGMWCAQIASWQTLGGKYE